MDIVAMVCKDLTIIPKDDYTNIESLKGKLLSDDMKKVLIKANGLRNRLTHRYNKTDDLLALESINELLPEFYKFTQDIKKWIREELRE